jgi:hypothetical protein
MQSSEFICAQKDLQIKVAAHGCEVKLPQER